MLKNFNFYQRASELINQKIVSVRDFSKKVIKKAKDFIAYGEYADSIKEITDTFIDDGLHFKQVELELLIEDEFKKVILDYQDTEDKTGFTNSDIENLNQDLKERYLNDSHTGVLRYRLFNSDFYKEQIPFVTPPKRGGLAKFADVEFMIDNKIQKVTIKAEDTYNQKGFAIRDFKNFDQDLKDTYGHNDTNGVVRFKLYDSLYEYTKTNYVYMNVEKVMTHSDLFDYLVNNETLMNVIITEAEENPAFLTFKKWVDMYNAIDAKIPRYAIYNNGQNYPLLDNDKVYYFEDMLPKANIRALDKPKEYTYKRKQRKYNRHVNRKSVA